MPRPTPAPTLFDEQAAADLWERALAFWSVGYTIGDPERALRVELRRRTGRVPETASPEQLAKFLVDVEQGAIR